MPNWLSAMEQTYEYYIVDPGTWKDVQKLTTVVSCTITRDSSVETLGSATFDISESIGESYIRVYLITIQNGIREKHPLGTFLVQTPASQHDGKRRGFSIDAYTPLIELKESPPALGYTIRKGANVMDNVYRLTRERVRAPVVKPQSDVTLHDDFVAATNDTWMTFNADLAEKAKHKYGLDALGRIIFDVEQDVKTLQPVWTYDDDNSSILYPDVSVTHDLYGIPNVIEVLYTNGSGHFYAKVVNDDPNSPTSVVSRGREIVQRVTDPNIGGIPTENQVREYAERLLKTLSTIEYTATYKHGYCPVQLGDCVRLNYRRGDMIGIKGRVISQSIKCEPGCPVTEKIVYAKQLWR